MNTGDEENITTSFYKSNLTLQNIKFRKLIARPSETSVRILKSKYLGLLIPYTCCVCYIFFVIVSATIQALAIISGSYAVKLEQYLFFLLLLFERRRVWWRTSKIGFKDYVIVTIIHSYYPPGNRRRWSLANLSISINLNKAYGKQYTTWSRR